MQPMQGISGSAWNRLVAGLPGAHLLQTWEWGEVKSRVGWRALPFVWRDSPAADSRICAAALVLEKTIPVMGMAARMRLHYVPKGPAWDAADSALGERILDDLQAFARRRGAIFLKIDPDVSLGVGVPGQADEQPNPAGAAFVDSLRGRGWLFSNDQIQFRNTVLIDLHPPLETLLQQMKQKTRYNIHLAERKGVQVRLGSREDFAWLYQAYVQTAVRDGFIIRDSAYYQAVWQAFLEGGMADFLIAEVEQQPVAALALFSFAQRAYYLYGMSTASHRDKMPNYLLQWQAICRARERGCTLYDLWGAPGTFDESDSMWGVFRFKEGLGGRVMRTAGAWDFPARPWLYKLYTRTLPHILDWMRRRGRQRINQEVSQI